MSRIVLTAKQKEILQKHLNGEYSPFIASEEDQIALNDVIDMADDLMSELDAYEDAGNNLMAWFWGKYQYQYQEQEQQ